VLEVFFPPLRQWELVALEDLPKFEVPMEEVIVKVESASSAKSQAEGSIQSRALN